MGRLVLAFLVGTALSMAACGGGGGGEKSETPTPQIESPVATGTAAPTQGPENEETKAARAAAEKTFLKLEDFPAVGWKQAPAAATTPTPEELDLPSECQSPLLSRKPPPDSIVQADSPEFDNDKGSQVASRVIVFQDEGTAQKYMDAVNKFIDDFNGCRQRLLEALNDTGGAQAGATPVSQTTDVSVEKLAIDSMGDQSVALGLTISIEAGGIPLSLRSDLVAVRVGRMVSLLGYLSSTVLASPELSEEGRLAGIVADCLKDAAKELD